MRILYTSKFDRDYKKLPEQIKDAAEQSERIFREDAFHPSLRTHKLGGKWQGFWSFSIGYRYRIIFEFGPDGIVYFHAAGDHNVYQ